MLGEGRTGAQDMDSVSMQRAHEIRTLIGKEEASDYSSMAITIKVDEIQPRCLRDPCGRRNSANPCRNETPVRKGRSRLISL